MARTEPQTRTLIVTCKGNAIRKIEIPIEWKVTYGPVTIGSSRGMNGGDSPNVLRLYSDASKNNLQAVFRDVLSFVDESVKVRERIVKTKKKAFNRDEANGKQAYTAEVRKVVWRDPMADAEDDDGSDDLGEEILALPAGMDAG